MTVDLSDAALRHSAAWLRRGSQSNYPRAFTAAAQLDALRAEWERLRIEREEYRLDSLCDACIGRGIPESGGPCMCGGTGKAADAVRHLRGWAHEYRTALLWWCKAHCTELGTHDSNCPAEMCGLDGREARE